MLDSALGSARACKNSTGASGRDSGWSPRCGIGGQWVDVSAVCIDHRSSAGRLSTARAVPNRAGRCHMPTGAEHVFHFMGGRKAGDFGSRWCKTVAPCDLESNGTFSRSLFESGWKLAGDRGRDIVLES
jgi:hypothetical protein